MIDVEFLNNARIELVEDYLRLNGYTPAELWDDYVAIWEKDNALTIRAFLGNAPDEAGADFIFYDFDTIEETSVVEAKNKGIHSVLEMVMAL